MNIETLAGDQVKVTEVKNGFVNGCVSIDPEPRVGSLKTGECYSSLSAQDWLTVESFEALQQEELVGWLRGRR